MTEVTDPAMPTTDVTWLEYEQALDRARREHKLVLLALSAAWCPPEWSPLGSADGSQAAPDWRTRDEICRQLVLARLDVERRPDVYRHYAAASVPSALLLDSNGRVLLGDGAATDTIDSESGRIQRLPSPHPSHLPTPVDLRTTLATIESTLLASLDQVHGGFGVAPKYLEGHALIYALDRFQRTGSQRWHEVFALTLDSVTRGLFDATSGGFYRSASWRDWQAPHPAKLLGVNAEAVRAYMRAYEVTQRAGYLEVASRSLQFALATLRGPAFYGSLSPTSRLDRTIFLPPNEEMVVTLLLSAQVTGESSYAELARLVQRFLLENMFDPQRGFAHYHDGAPHLHGLLLDNAAALVGLARAYAALAEHDFLVTATQTADLILRVFLGATASSDSAISLSPDFRFEDGALAAEGLLFLGKITGSVRYSECALRLAGILAHGMAGQRASVLARYGSLVQDLLDTGAGGETTPSTAEGTRGGWRQDR